MILSTKGIVLHCMDYSETSIIARVYTEQLGFIEDAILNLDRATESISGFPLAFTIGLTQFLGFDPHNNFDAGTAYFDMVEGNFCSLPPEHPYYFYTPLSKNLSDVLTVLYSGQMRIVLPNAIRNELLAKMLEYIKIHIPAIGEIKSVQVLSDVMRD